MTYHHVIEDELQDYLTVYTENDKHECYGIGCVVRKPVVVIDSLDPERYHEEQRWFCYEHDGCFLDGHVQDVTGYATREEALGKFLLEER